MKVYLFMIVLLVDVAKVFLLSRSVNLAALRVFFSLCCAKALLVIDVDLSLRSEGRSSLLQLLLHLRDQLFVRIGFREEFGVGSLDAALLCVGGCLPRLGLLGGRLGGGGGGSSSLFVAFNVSGAEIRGHA